MVREDIRLVFSTKHRRPFLRDKTLPEATHVAVQEEHHRTMSFQDELRALLRKHHVEWVGKIPVELMVGFTTLAQAGPDYPPCPPSWRLCVLDPRSY